VLTLVVIPAVYLLWKRRGLDGEGGPGEGVETGP
jgi:hypothetical protein